MNGGPASNVRIQTLEIERSSAEIPPEASLSTVIVATVDTQIRDSLAELLQAHSVEIVWAKSVKEVRSALARGSVSACFCGLWLIDGTYRDVIRHLKSRSTEIPAIIACPQEYQDYFAALDIRAFDFMPFPYNAAHLERVLRSALQTHNLSERRQLSTRADWNDSSDQGKIPKAG